MPRTDAHICAGMYLLMRAHIQYTHSKVEPMYNQFVRTDSHTACKSKNCLSCCTYNDAYSDRLISTGEVLIAFFSIKAH